VSYPLSELPNELYLHLPKLLATIIYREDEMEAAKARGESLRTYEKMAKLIEDIRTLGY
jgi:hypothetical protein